MDPIENTYDKIISTRRLVDESGNYKEEYDDYLKDISCHIQPLDGSFYEDADGQFGKNSLMVCNPCDIEINDMVIYGSIEYKVIEVKDFSFYGHEHMEIIIREYA